LVEIAVDLQRALDRRRVDGRRGAATPRVIGRGVGWRAADVICTSGPSDRRFQEQHSHHSVAVVVAGTFQLRSSAGQALMVPGSLMLGNEGQPFECGHEHGHGDRCVSFYFEPDYFERLARDAGALGRRPAFATSRIPPVRELSRLIAEAGSGLVGTPVDWEELAVRAANAALTLGNGVQRSSSTPPNAIARVTRAVRAIDNEPDAAHTLTSLSRDAGLSPFHFLRTFERLVGLTPHQYVRRCRLHHAARRLTTSSANVLDIALDCGFGDVSNFNHAFRAEYGVSPTRLRRQRAHA
jgi:AraC family transcriptional regulator